MIVSLLQSEKNKAKHFIHKKKFVSSKTFATFVNDYLNIIHRVFILLLMLFMSTMSHAEGHHNSGIIMIWLGIVAALMVNVMLTLVLHSGYHWERYAVGIAGALMGILMGTTSNGNSSNPGGQKFMEWMGMICFVTGVLRFLHVGDVFAKAFADSPALSSVMKFLLLFI